MIEKNMQTPDSSNGHKKDVASVSCHCVDTINIEQVLTRLNSEHRSLLELNDDDEVICDGVMTNAKKALEVVSMARQFWCHYRSLYNSKWDVTLNSMVKGDTL